MRGARGRAILGVLPLSLIAGACLETTVRPTESRIITAAEAAERRRAADDADAAIEEAEDAEEEAREQLDRDPDNPRWAFEVGRYEESAGRLVEAEQLYRRGLARLPPDKYTGPHLFLGRALLKQGRLAEARRELERVIAIRPADEALYVRNRHYQEAHYLLGVAQFQLGERDAARASFGRYLALGGARHHIVGYFPDLAVGP